MRTLRAAAATALAMTFLATAAPAAPTAGHGLGLEYRDTTCAPCRDFFQYANGGWMAYAVIPPSYSAYGCNEELEDRSEAALRDLLDAAVRNLPSAPAGSDAQRLGLYYCSCMDSAGAEAAGIKPLEPQLQRVAALRDAAGLSAEIARLHDQGVPVLFRLYASQDPGNSGQFIAWAHQGGLGLPDRDYYTRTDSTSTALLKAYRDHVARTFALLGDPAGQAGPEADRVLAIETALARASMTLVQRRDPRATYNKTSLDRFTASCPGFDWAGYLRRPGLPHLDSLNVAQPLFFRGLDSLLAAVPLPDWRTYLRWKIASHAAPLLSTAFVNEDFSFRRRLTGATELLPRWKRCLRATDDALGEALGQAYVQRFFPPAAKARAQDMVRNLENTLADRLGRLAWMDESTRQAAIAKLRAFHNKVGYPDRWRDYSAMQLTPGSWYANAAEADHFEVKRQLDKIGRPLDRNEWEMTPPTVNAYYEPGMNEICFPAGILQPPFFFFDPDADDAVNYGATGATIGHEMTHGFDDEGRQFDAQGNLRDWWTPADARRYQEQADKVVAQFNRYVAVDTLHLNGRLTLGENIADLGGLVIAYEAFEKTLQGKPRVLLDGLTPEQRFFIAYAQSWRWIWRPERTRRSTLADPHSPPKWRVNGPLENMPEFSRAFGCRRGDPMARPDSLRIQIW